jgi:hypothetical protein
MRRGKYESYLVFLYREGKPTLRKFIILIEMGNYA